MSQNTVTDLLSDGAHDLVDALTTEVGGRVDREEAQAVDCWHLIENWVPRRGCWRAITLDTWRDGACNC